MRLAITEAVGTAAVANTLRAPSQRPIGPRIFGAQNLFAANLWLLTADQPYVLAGFRAFRNFDGANHDFGDTSVQATSSNIASVSAYVSTDSTRRGRVVIVAINRTASAQQTTFTGQPLAGTAHLFQMSAAMKKHTNAADPGCGGRPAGGAIIADRDLAGDECDEHRHLLI